MGTVNEQAGINRHGFAVLSGVRRAEDNHFTLAYPPSEAGKRKGTLALMVEGAGDHPSLAEEACEIVLETITRAYFEDNALSVTTALTNAIEIANSAVLEHCYAPASGIAVGAEPPKVGVQTSGARTRSARVGLTALLFRPDGTGIYLSQLAPTQAYLVHNGLISALPEPKGWRAGHEASEGNSEPINFLPAQSLGSQPGLVTDLTFRRVEPGDRVILVSTSLARLVDRGLADNLFFAPDAATISEELYDLATKNGVARASASVLEVGMAVATPAPAVETVRERKSVLAAPKEWLERRRATPIPEPVAPIMEEVATLDPPGQPAAPPEADQTPTHVPPPYLVTAEAPAQVAEQTPQEEIVPEPPAPKQPTLTLLQRQIEAPPYLAAMRSEASETLAENTFDGWEDAPPALGKRPIPTLGRIEAQVSGGKVSPDEWRELYNRTGDEAPEMQYRVLTTSTSPPPQIFGDAIDIWEEDAISFGTEDAPNVPAARSPRFQVNRVKVQAGAQRALQWSRTALHGLLPEKRPATEHAQIPAAAAPPKHNRARGRGYVSLPRRSSGPATFDGLRDLNIPRRPFIAVAVVVLALVLILSMLALGGNGGSSSAQATTDFLQQARQAELQANQPGNSPAARREGLLLAREKATQALAAAPESAEAKRLLARIETDMDRLDGVTRLREPKLLFDLDATQAGAQPATAGQPVTATGALSEIVIGGNDAFLLDEVNGRVYRCQLATQSCAPTLQAGDSVSGQTVGALIHMVQRVGNVVAIDDKLTSYLFDADAGAWSAQPLGDASALARPVDVATYDGHLYLLGAKPGQISKYSSGNYGLPPTDWIFDPGSVQQVKDPIAMAIDGAIYTLLADGRVLVMQGGKVSSTLTPQSGSNAVPAELFTDTGTRDLYILYPANGTIARMTKEGQTLAVLKTPDGHAQSMSGLAVDEGKSKLYILEGRKVYEAVLPGRPAQDAPTGESQTQTDAEGDVAPAGPPVPVQPTASP